MAQDQQHDLAGVQHWEGVYRASQVGTSAWRPSTYDSKVLERILLGEIRRAECRTILEVGCGNSAWLPYLATQAGAEATGIDYSSTGCEMARKQLAKAGVAGNILCADLFTLAPGSVPPSDGVYSIGLAEHFADLAGILRRLALLVRPGGILITVVPNLYRSIHWLMAKVYQPELLAKHRFISVKQLRLAYQQAGMTAIRAHYAGLFSLDIVAWGLYPRWPSLSKRLEPRILSLNRLTDRALRRIGMYRGAPGLAPFIYAVGRKQ